MVYLEKLNKDLFYSAIFSIEENPLLEKYLQGNDFFYSNHLRSEKSVIEELFKNLYKANLFACLSAGLLNEVKKEDLDFDYSKKEVVLYEGMGLLALLDKIYFNIDDYNENKYCDPKLYKFFTEIIDEVKRNLIYSNHELMKEYKF